MMEPATCSPGVEMILIDGLKTSVTGLEKVERRGMKRE